MSKQDKLAKFLREASNWRWDEFWRAERDKQYTTNQAIIFALIRACAMEKMEAIKIALNRIDGKLKTPVRVEMPKVYYLYPYATLPDAPEAASPLPAGDPDEPSEAIEGEVLPAPIKHDATNEPRDLPSMGLRETLSEMSDYPRELPEQIVKLALETEQWLQGNGPKPDEIPMVKSVVAAHLLIMAQSRNIDALTEVFDQIDGKLVETIQVLGPEGGDIYITMYATTAPPGAKLNADGVLQIEATQTQETWANKLGDKS